MVTRPKRAAFTLVELLVAIAIILTIAAMVVYFIDWRSKDVVTDGANQVMTWLSQARERALRDQQFVGLRLLPNSNLLATSATFISEAPDWTPASPPVTLTVTPAGTSWSVDLGSQSSGTFTLSYGGSATAPNRRCFGASGVPASVRSARTCPPSAIPA